MYESFVCVTKTATLFLYEESKGVFSSQFVIKGLYLYAFLFLKS